MRVYLDSSAALTRVLAESESADLVAALDKHHTEGDVLMSSSLAWIEVARAVRSLHSATLADHGLAVAAPGAATVQGSE